ncbi:MAG: LPS export ABC transporter periplasmic protein LptC [Candidatus Melainabacteria bacterium]|nr:LPS export ABC transporter periplasmic protein LptC [Candidatus Melainabacteria bacterium]
MAKIKKTKDLKLIPLIVVLGLLLFFIISFVKGTFLVNKSEKELNPKNQSSEALAQSYNLKEIDSKTGLIRWQLVAKEGKTEENLQAAIIKDIKAEVFKNNQIIFKLNAPYAKANAGTKEIYLFGDVTASDIKGDLLLKCNELTLGMGTSIEARKGFNLLLKNNGSVIGENVLINDDQTKIIVTNLKEASFKDILLSGTNVHIEKNKDGEITKAIISNGGNIILKNEKNNKLSAEILKWELNGNTEAINNVSYTSSDKTFKAEHLIIKPNKNIYADNNVTIIHGETKCFGTLLSFENNSDIVLSGKSKAVQGKKQISADKIVYNINTGKVQALGNVKTTIINKV